MAPLGLAASRRSWAIPWIPSRRTFHRTLQGDIERVTYGTFTETARKIWADSSLPGFYRGATYRYGRMACAVFIMDFLKDKMGVLLYPAAFAS